MSEIRNRRLQLSLSQGQLAELCGISPSQLCRCEQDEKAGSEETMARIRAHLGLGVEAKGRALAVRVVRRMRLRARPAERTRRRDSWLRVLQCHRGWLARLGGPTLPGWFREECDCDSAPEFLSLLQLLVAGGCAVRCSPLALGFLQQPLLCSDKLALGTRPIPCIHLRLDTLELIYFPQVSMRTSKRDCRVDGLVLCRAGRRKCWLVVEIDGGGHDGWGDEERTRWLGLPVVRMSADSVLRLEFVGELRAELKRLLKI